MSWKTVEEILYIDDPIRPGFDWGGATGFALVSDENISSYAFSLALKHGEQTIATLNESNGSLTQSGNFTLYMKLTNSQTGIIKKGLTLTGDLLGNLNGVNRFFGTIQVQTK